jgi:integrase
MTSLLIESNAYKNFINTVDSEATKQNYRYTFTKFMEFCGLDNYDKMLLIEPKKLEGLMRDYITHLKIDKNLSYNTVSLYVASVSHFYQMNDFVMNWKKLSKFKGKKRLVVEDKPYTKEQIRHMLDFADLRMKCIILLMSSAGLRRGALPQLRIRDLTKIEKHGLYKISVYKNEAEAYTTFCTPECTRYLDEYFDWRAVQGEKLTDTSPVLRKDFSSLNVAKPKTITAHGIDWMVSNLLDKSCIRPKTPNKLKRTEYMTNHAFRKYFQTTAKLAGMDSLLIDRCMGHKTGLNDPYTKLNGDQTLEGNDKMIGYIGAIDDLMIDDSNRLRGKVSKLEQKEQELQEIKSKLDEFSTWKQSVTDNIKTYFQKTTGTHYQINDFERLNQERLESIRKQNEKRRSFGLPLLKEE